MRECPGIYSRRSRQAEQPRIAGTGVAVWDVLRDSVHDDDAERLRPVFCRSPAPAYRRGTTRDTRKRSCARGAKAALASEVLERRCPGLVRVVRSG